MIYVSSSCVKNKKIKDSVLELADEGFRNIELSGGTDFYDGYLEDLLELKKKYSLQYLVHNYFPPPQEHFMLNLSELNEELYKKSIRHCKQAISLCKQLGSKKYGIHAGYLIGILPSEAGKVISLKKIYDREFALKLFSDAWNQLRECAGKDVCLYVENNVFSKSNKQNFQLNNPFLLTDYKSWLEFSKKINCRLLLDFAHLKVSTKSLGLSFKEQMDKMVDLTDYYHISGNDGMHDQNYSVKSDPEIMSVLENNDWSSKTFTLEVYDGLNSLHESFEYLRSEINC